MNKYIFGFLIAFLTFNFLFLLLQPADAFMMTNDSFNIQGSINSSSQTLFNSQYKIQGTTDQNTPQTLKSTNFTINSLLDSSDKKNRKDHFTFTLSKNSIDFGILSPTNPILRDQTIAITTGPTASGYSLNALSNHELQDKSDTTIPSTTCDNGTCSIYTASDWTNILTYGYGYRCDGSDCENSFSQPTYYKQFPLISKEETFIPIITGVQNSRAIESKITHKVTISRSQKEADYFNTITYIASPNF